MQMPNANNLMRESMRLVKSGDDRLYKEASRSGKSVRDAENKSAFCMLNMVDLAHINFGTKYLKLKWKKFDQLASKVGGARNIFYSLFGHHKAENTFWLDSSSIEKVF